MGFQKIQRAAATAGVVLSSILPGTIAAQVVVRGILFDDAKGTPVRGTVMLVDPRTDAPIVHSATDSLGQFDLHAGTGVYQIAAVTAGYTSVLSAPVSFENGEQLVVRVPIAVSGDPQHQISVLEHVRPSGNKANDVNRRSAREAMSAFEMRRAAGLGLHYDRMKLAKSNLRTLGEFLQSVPGLAVLDPNSTSSMQMSRSMSSSFTGSSASSCHIGWFIDGQRIDLPGRSDPLTDGLGQVSLDAIEGVEVFRGLSEMPPEFAAPDLRCGAVSIWNRRSN